VDWNAGTDGIVVLGLNGKSDCHCWSLVDPCIESAVVEVAREIFSERQRRLMAVGPLYEYEEEGPTSAPTPERCGFGVRNRADLRETGRQQPPDPGDHATLGPLGAIASNREGGKTQHILST
jgi:hypothetical protein